MLIRRGEIWWADFGTPRGSEQGGQRPALIIQNNTGNTYSTTTIIAAITSKTKASYPFHVEVSAQESGLSQDSTILLEQILTISKGRLIRRASVLSLARMGDVDYLPTDKPGEPGPDPAVHTHQRMDSPYRSTQRLYDHRWIPQRLYDTVRWRKVAKRLLSSHPLCIFCLKIGRDTPATVVDHIVPHRNDPVLFWSVDNLQPLCKTCHDNAKKLQEIHGYSQAAGVDGLPVDKDHPWNKKT